MSKFIVYVQGDEPNQWLPALPFQEELYKLSNELGDQSNCLYSDTETETIKEKNFHYKIVVTAGWSQRFIINCETRKSRKIIGMELPEHDGA